MISDKTKILIVEDQKLIRESLKLILNDTPNLEVVAEAEDGEESIELAKQCRPDIVLMDIGLPRMDGIKATKILKEIMPDVKVIILTCRTFGEEVTQALEAGIDAYFVKDNPTDVLIQVISHVKQGIFWTDPLIASFVKSQMTHKPTSSKNTFRKEHSDLTDKEFDVLKLLVAGKSNEEICNEMHISENKAKTYLDNIVDKLVVDDASQAVKKAKEEGFV